MLKILGVFLAAASLGGAHALTLSPLGEPSNPPLAIDPYADLVPCDQIITSLDNYNNLARQNDGAVISYLGQVRNALADWHAALVPLEGKAQTVPAGTFSVLEDGGSKMDRLNQAASENSSLLAAELARIKDSIVACQAPAAHRAK